MRQEAGLKFNPKPKRILIYVYSSTYTVTLVLTHTRSTRAHKKYLEKIRFISNLLQLRKESPVTAFPFSADAFADCSVHQTVNQVNSLPLVTQGVSCVL
jgi:hypothetical protein